MQNQNIKETYDQRYREGYRSKLEGFEIARWQALDHFIKKNIPIAQLKNILDYGCGSGSFIDLWKSIFSLSDLYFADISTVAMEQLKEKHPEFNSKCFPIINNQMQISKKTFHAIVSIEVMEHVYDLDAYLTDVYRLLKPGGYFIWTTPCANNFSIEHIYALLTNNIQKTAEGYRRWKFEDPTHLRRLKSTEAERLLMKKGFSAPTLSFRAHFFSFVCTELFSKRLKKLGEKLMLLDYAFFRNLPNGASMIGCAQKNK